ncbi:hypothetical protein OROHE_001362 [Orobanche hederae]
MERTNFEGAKRRRRTDFSPYILESSSSGYISQTYNITLASGSSNNFVPVEGLTVLESSVSMNTEIKRPNSTLQSVNRSIEKDNYTFQHSSSSSKCYASIDLSTGPQILQDSEAGLKEMSDNGSVPSPPMKDSDHLFGPSEIGPKFAYEAGIRRKIISNNDMFPEWAGHVRRLRACELEEGGSLCNHILEMMNYMNKLEYLDTNFDRNLAVPLLLRSLPDSYNDFLWKNHCENKSKTWIEIINELRRYEEDKITQKGKLEEEKGKEKRKEKHYALDAQVGSSKRRKSCSWRDLGNGERKCPKNIEESIGSSS